MRAAFGTVADGLPVAADGHDIFGRPSGVREQRLDHSGIASCQSVAGERDPMDLVVAGAVERQHLGTQVRCEIPVLVGQDPEGCRRRGGEVDRRYRRSWEYCPHGTEGGSVANR